MPKIKLECSAPCSSKQNEAEIPIVLKREPNENEQRQMPPENPPTPPSRPTENMPTMEEREERLKQIDRIVFKYGEEVQSVIFLNFQFAFYFQF